MAELQPHITYSPEGILTVERPQPEALEDVYGVLWRQADLNRLEAQRDRSIATLDELTGVTIIEEERGAGHSIRIDADVMRPSADIAQKLLIEHLDNFSIARRTSTSAETDQVLPFHDIARTRVVVTEHFQRWLNTQLELGDEVAKHCLGAMALPFGSEDLVENSFYAHHSDTVSVASAGPFRVYVRREPFGIEKIQPRRWGADVERQGTVDWNWLQLSIEIPVYPSVGANGDVRQSVRQDPHNKNLYVMHGHEIMGGTRALSMLLGLGSLAHHATSYKGSEDVFADASWGKPRRAFMPDMSDSPSYALG